MSGYCPAGKCECNAYFVSYNEHGKTEACSVSVIDLSKYEVCPWPSRQQRIEKPLLGIEEEQRVFNHGHAAGRLAGLREAKEAVDSVPRWRKSETTGTSANPNGFTFQYDSVLAAIDRLMEDGK
jgi:hypothetical protein